jgi:8-oxo-dGTP pyrophosphatase MutT (NUDIX family)
MSRDSLLAGGGPLLAGGGPLVVGDAVAAIICVEAEGYLMQLRDARPDIWYPDHWGLFGGGIDPGEDPLQALQRELYEELELRVPQTEFFARIDFDLGGLGLPRYYRSYYVVRIARDTEASLQLHEGAAKRVFRGSEILREPKVTPYDAFALFLHHQRTRLISPP